MASKGRTKVFPHLWYAKEAEAAAKFYASIFPDSRVDRVTPMLSESPSGPPGSVKIVDFTLLGQRFQAMTAGPHHEFNDAISIVVLCDDQAELDRYWNALLEGGGKAQACGWLIDRFGLRWQIVPAILDELMRDKDPARSQRVTDALLRMVKLDIAALEKRSGSEPINASCAPKGWAATPRGERRRDDGRRASRRPCPCLRTTSARRARASRWRREAPCRSAAAAR